MKSIWTGALSFGLVNIPLRVYPASEEHVLEFDMLHKKDLSPIRYARICKLDGEEIPYNEIVKGYEYSKGEYIALETQDFKNANPQKTSSIEIQEFVDHAEIDPIFYEKPYYLEPDKKSAKAYALFREALTKSGKVAIAKFVFRNREHVGVIFPIDKVLLLMQIRYSSEIRSFDELNLPDYSKNDKEISMALQLIEQLTTHFKPGKYKDSYIEELNAIIEAKLSGKKQARTQRKAKSAQSGDLMHLLKQSLEKALQEESQPSKKMRLPKTPTKKKRKSSS